MEIPVTTGYYTDYMTAVDMRDHMAASGITWQPGDCPELTDSELTDSEEDGTDSVNDSCIFGQIFGQRYL